MRPWAIITLPALYIIFSLAAALAGLWGLLSVVFTRGVKRLSRICSAMDRLAAAALGWDGRSTISRECGLEVVSGTPCRFCRMLCRVLSVVLQKNHCEDEAKS